MFVFVHIPKTAGTAMGYVFDYSTDRRVFWDYDAGYRFAKQMQPEIAENIGFISSYFQIIFGHFFATKYREALPDSPCLVSIRHPVDRIISQYYHVGSAAHSWQGKEISEGRMNVVEFAKTENIANAQTIHLDGVPMDEIAHVFLSEHLERSIKAFELKFDFRFKVSVPKINTKSDRDEARKNESKIVPVTDDDRRKIFGLCGEDVDLYKAAVASHAADRKRYF